MQNFTLSLETHQSRISSYNAVRAEILHIRDGIRDMLEKLSLERNLQISQIQTQNEIRQVSTRVSALRDKLRTEESQLVIRRARLEEDRSVFETRKRKMINRDMLSYEEYQRDFLKYDKRLNALHPYRRLRSISRSLCDERRQLCLKLFSMFNFRSVSISTSSLEIELLGDFLDPDSGDKDQMPLLIQFIVPLLISIASVLDVSLPFPLAIGSCLSSPCLDICPPVPVIVHVFKDITATELGILLIEDLRFIAAAAQNISIGSVPDLADPLALLSLTIHAPNPTISASSSYRKPPVIEQSVTEGGEWTLLDQL